MSRSDVRQQTGCSRSTVQVADPDAARDAVCGVAGRHRGRGPCGL